MRLLAFKYGETEITQDAVFPGGNKETPIRISLLFFLIEENDRKILVDVGCDTMPGYKLFQFELPVNVLGQYGVTPQQITDIVITHTHHDHIQAVCHYPQATIHLHQSGLEEARAYIPDLTRVCTFGESKSINERIEIRHVGGHSVDSSIVLISCDGFTYVLCGDECYTKENLLKNIPTGNGVCPEMSKWFVEEYRKDIYRPILFHDPDVLGKIGYQVIYED